MPISIVTPAQFKIDNPSETVNADKAIKQINDNLQRGKTTTLFSGKDQVNPLGKFYPERIALILAAFQSVGWTVTVRDTNEGITVSLSAIGVE